MPSGTDTRPSRPRSTRDPEDRDEYTAQNVFWVPKQARWQHLQARAPEPAIGKLVDDAMSAIGSPGRSTTGQDW